MPSQSQAASIIGPRLQRVAEPSRDGLLIAGDRVTIGTGGQREYRIVHISDRKAWVYPLQEGEQQIIRTGDLCLVGSSSVPAAMLS